MRDPYAILGKVTLSAHKTYKSPRSIICTHSCTSAVSLAITPHPNMLPFLTGFLRLVLQFGCCKFVRAQNESSVSCISFYDQARKSVLGDDGNCERILNAFYPLNASSPHLVWVFYYVNGSNISSLDFPSICHQLEIPSNGPDANTSHVADYIYVLADQPIWLTFDIRLILSSTITFRLIIDGYGTCLHLIIDPLCNETKFADQLGLFTSWVSESFDCISHICLNKVAVLA